MSKETQLNKEQFRKSHPVKQKLKVVFEMMQVKYSEKNFWNLCMIWFWRHLKLKRLVHFLANLGAMGHNTACIPTGTYPTHIFCGIKEGCLLQCVALVFRLRRMTLIRSVLPIRCHGLDLTRCIRKVNSGCSMKSTVGQWAVFLPYFCCFSPEIGDVFTNENEYSNETCWYLLTTRRIISKFLHFFYVIAIYLACTPACDLEQSLILVVTERQTDTSQQHILHLRAKPHGKRNHILNYLQMDPCQKQTHLFDIFWHSWTENVIVACMVVQAVV